VVVGDIFVDSELKPAVVVVNGVKPGDDRFVVELKLTDEGVLFVTLAKNSASAGIYIEYNAICKDSNTNFVS